MKILLYDTGDIRNEFNEPIGIEVIASYLIANTSEEIDVNIMWYNKNKYDFDIAEYEIIGISFNIGTQEIFNNILRKIELYNRKAIVVVGNVWGTYGYEYLLKLYPHIICVIGEGEEAFYSIVNNRLSLNKSLESIPNLAFLRDGKLCLTEKVVMDLNRYVPPKRVFKDYLIKNNGIGRIEGSRGCSWNKCSFCSTQHKYSQNGWRAINVENVITQLIELNKAGFRSVYFTDEDFIGTDIKHFRNLVNSIKKCKEDLLISDEMNFFISVKPVDIIRPDCLSILELFISCGLREIFVGIESGSKSQILRYKKCSNVSISSKALENLKQLDVTVDVGFILFDTNMSLSELQENIEFIEKHELYNYDSNFIKKMRIHPYSQIHLLNKYNETLYFNPMNLSYDYRFDNEIIEQIYKDYSNLQMEKYAISIQSYSRGEIISEKYRIYLKKALSRIRLIQFLSLKEIIRFHKDKLLSSESYNKSITDLEKECYNIYKNMKLS